MFIKIFQIKNFKPFKDITIHFNEDVNILVGENNTGKTSILEAIALWHECFAMKFLHIFPVCTIEDLHVFDHHLRLAFRTSNQ